MAVARLVVGGGDWRRVLEAYGIPTHWLEDNERGDYVHVIDLDRGVFVVVGNSGVEELGEDAWVERLMSKARLLPQFSAPMWYSNDVVYLYANGRPTLLAVVDTIYQLPALVRALAAAGLRSLAKKISDRAIELIERHVQRVSERLRALVEELRRAAE